MKKKNYKKIGILGGSFDPPHYGHVEISKIAIKKFKLKKVIWIATKKNPLKTNAKYNLKTRIDLSKKILKKQKKIISISTNKILSSKNTYNLLKRTSSLFNTSTSYWETESLYGICDIFYMKITKSLRNCHFLKTLKNC